MRISDWSSDVCSSDLTPFIQRWGAIAAALVVGLFAGQLVDMPGGGGNLVKGSDGNLVASGKLAAALDSQLASDNPQALGSPVRIGLTFVGGGGGYCRTFSAVRADSLSGIACRLAGAWRLRKLGRASCRERVWYYG